MPQPLQLGHFAAGCSFANALTSASLCSCGTSGCVGFVTFLVFIEMLRMDKVGLWDVMDSIILPEPYKIVSRRQASMCSLGEFKNPTLDPVTRAMKDCSYKSRRVVMV